MFYGVANNSPTSFVDQILKAGFSSSDICLMPINKTLKETKPKFKILLVLTNGDFKRNLPLFKSKAYENVKVVFFANAMRLFEYKNLVGLDYVPDPEFPGYGFKLSAKIDMRAFKKDAPNDVVRENGNYLDNIMAHVREGSLLNPLLTFIYSIPAPNQLHVRLLFAHYLYEGRKPDELRKAINALPIENKVIQKILNKVEQLVFNSVGEAFKAAFADFRKDNKDKTKIPTIARRHKVSEYEMKYLLAILSDEESGKAYIHSFETARKKNIKDSSNEKQKPKKK